MEVYNLLEDELQLDPISSRIQEVKDSVLIFYALSLFG